MHKPCAYARAVAVVATFFFCAPSAEAWIFPEHTRATHQAFERLSPNARAALKKEWAVADSAAEPPHSPRKMHLCKDLETTPNGRLDPDDDDDWCVGFSVLPALAADHSCSPGFLMKTLRTSRWVRPALELSMDTATKLAEAGNSVARRLDVRRGQHLRLQILDDEYATRAENNNSHFQLPRSATIGRDSITDYVATVSGSRQLANATASFIHYHAAALELARYAAALRTEGRPHAYYTQWAFFNEAFAVHFLEDSFSAGHFVGTSGDAAQRLGTHDYYCQNGVDALTWSGERYDARGDAFMGDREAERVAEAVAASLQQLGEAFEGNDNQREYAGLDAGEDPVAIAHQLDYDFEICHPTHVPPTAEIFASSYKLLAVLDLEPIPPAEQPALPRFRTELGFNVGPSFSIDGTISSALGASEPFRGSGRTRLGVRVGLGVTDLLTRSEDGNSFFEGIVVGERGSDASRSGFGMRIHAPFAYVPLDGIPASFCALAIRSPACVVWSRRAASGSVYRINPSRRIGQYASVGITAFRDLTVIFLNEGGLRGPTRRDLLASLFTIRTGTDYSGRLATHIGVDFGIQWRHQYGLQEEDYLGGFISLFTDTPYYFWP